MNSFNNLLIVFLSTKRDLLSYKSIHCYLLSFLIIKTHIFICNKTKQQQHFMILILPSSSELNNITTLNWKENDARLCG